MQDITIDAVILREVLVGESDKLLTVLTAENGIMTVSAKGVKNIKSKNSAAVQLFCHSTLEVTKKGQRYILKTAALKNSFYGLRSEIERYALACYIAETAVYFCTEQNDETDAMRLILNAFYALSSADGKPLWLIKAAYEIKLCSVCGFMPSLSYCACCSGNIGSSEKRYSFSFAESGIICGKCSENNGGSSDNGLYYRLSAASLASLRFITASPIERFLSFRISDEYSLELSDFCERYLLYLAERSFDTLKYYNTVKYTSG